jgi:WD40 repeat protein
MQPAGIVNSPNTEAVSGSLGITERNHTLVRTFARALKLSQRQFTLFLVRCNYTHLRQQLYQELTQLGCNYRVVSLAEPTTKKLDKKLDFNAKVQGLLSPPQGYEYEQMPIFWQDWQQANHPEQFYTALCQQREKLAHQLRGPLVLWLEDTPFADLCRYGGDLVHWAVPAFSFTLSLGDCWEYLTECTDTAWQYLVNPSYYLGAQDQAIRLALDVICPPAVRLEELQAAQNQLLNALAQDAFAQESAPPLHLVTSNQKQVFLGKLEWLLGWHYGLNGQTNQALSHYEQSLHHWQQANDGLGDLVGMALTNIAMSQHWLDLSKPVTSAASGNRALDPLSPVTDPSQNLTKGHLWQQAENLLRQAMSWLIAGQREDLLAKYGHLLSQCLVRRKQWSELKEWLQELMPYHERRPFDLAQDCGYLTQVALMDAQWQEAQQQATTALTWLEQAEKLNSKSGKSGDRKSDDHSDGNHKGRKWGSKSGGLSLKQLINYGNYDGNHGDHQGDQVSDSETSAAPNGMPNAVPSSIPSFTPGAIPKHLFQLHRSHYKILLAQSLLRLGKINAAAKQLQQSENLLQSPAASTTGEVDYQQGIQLLALRYEVYVAQRKFLDAFRTKQQQRSLEQQYGLRAFIGAVSLQAKSQPKFQSGRNPQVTLTPGQGIAPEMLASGRSRDLHRLTERILSREHKLTVIHGQSGVGKSSLVNAGLVPTLNQQSYGDGWVIPVILRRYTDWVANLWEQLQFHNQRLVMENHALTTESKGLDTLSEALPEFLADSSDSGSVGHGVFTEANQPTVPEKLLRRLQQLSHQGHLVVLICDQFEEFFFTSSRTKQQQKFFEFWRICLQLPNLKLVLSIREDYLHLLLSLENLTHRLDILSRERRYSLGNLAAADAHALITSLTAQAHLVLEPSLIDALVADLAADTGMVRPIELQLVGTQLQDENITTLEQYRQVGSKQRLVERSLEEVIHACGQDAEFTARQVLLYLTDEQGTRPLRTYEELKHDLTVNRGNPELLPMVMEILVGSGLVFQFPEIPSARYQLVHDYLVSFIRSSKESGILAELNRLRSSALRSQAIADRITKVAMAGGAFAMLVVCWFAFKANEQRQLAEVDEIRALTSSAEARFASNRQLDALYDSIHAAQKLQHSTAAQKQEQLRNQVFTNLQNTTYNIYERNRFFNNFLTPNTEAVPFYAVRYSPDGRTIAAANYNGQVLLYAIDGELLATLETSKENTKDNPQGRNRVLRNLIFSPDGKFIVAGGDDGYLFQWEVASRKLINSTAAHKRKVNGLVYCPNNLTIVTASSDDTIKFWNSTTLVNERSFAANSDGVNDLDCHPQGSALLSSGQNGKLKLWDLQGNLIKETDSIEANPLVTNPNNLNNSNNDQRNNATAVYQGRFHPQKNLIVSAYGDQNIRLWEFSPLDGSPAKFTPAGIIGDKKNEFTIVRFSADGNQVITAGSGSANPDFSIRIWNLDGTLEAKLQGHEENIFDLNVHPKGNLIASASKDKTVRQWQGTGALLRTLQKHTKPLWTVSISPDGKTIASAGNDTSINLWQQNGQLLNTLQGHRRTIYGVSFSPDNKWIISASSDGIVNFWERNSGRLVKTFTGDQQVLTGAVMNHQGNLLATFGSNRNEHRIKLWKIDRNLQITPHLELKAHTQNIWAVSLHPELPILASASDDGSLKLWDTNTGKLLHSIDNAHPNGVLALAFLPNGKTIASVGKDRHLNLWDIDTGANLLRLEVADSWIYGVAVHPNGNTIAIAEADKKIHLWDLPTRTRVKTLVGHNAEVSALVYSPDGERLFSVSRDNTLRIWNAETLTLEQLVQRGCQWLEPSLKHDLVWKRERRSEICGKGM